MNDHVVTIGVSFADPSIPWPQRGSGETSLCEREGWTRQSIPVTIRGDLTTMEAMVNGQLAVNVMIEDVGFAISLAETGWRMSYYGRVFARCADAMVAAEAMMRENQSWHETIERGHYSDEQIRIIKRITDAAEQRGEILLDRVFPS